MTELLTIALPVYKRTDFVRQALDSAVRQSIPCKVLLIDNNSPHYEFKEILESYNYPHARYVRMDETVPQDENFNNCFKYAETPWVTILHDDDMLHYQFVEHSQKIFEKYQKKVGGITYKSYVSDKVWEGLTEAKELTNDIRIVKEPFFFFSHLTPFPGVIVKKDKAMELGGFINDLHPIADFDFWYRYSKTENMFLVNQQMAFYRISPSQSTNHLTSRMINNIYSYRKNILEESRYNNFLSRLALEKTRLTNIDFFKTTYNDFQLPDEIVDREKMEKARYQLKNRILRKMADTYSKYISYTRP